MSWLSLLHFPELYWEEEEDDDHNGLYLLILMSWIISSQNSYVEALTLNVMVFRYGLFGRYLGLDEVMRVGPTWRGKGTHMCEDTLRRPLSASQRDNPPRTLPCWQPDLGLPASRTVKKSICFLSPKTMVFCYGSSSWLNTFIQLYIPRFVHFVVHQLRGWIFAYCSWLLGLKPNERQQKAVALKI